MKNFTVIYFLLTICIFQGASAQKITYTYDKAERLIQVIYPNSIAINYTYDKDGNRIVESSETVLANNNLSFSAVKQNTEVLLSWSVSEINITKYEVEFSLNGYAFSSFAFVNAKGPSSGQPKYSTIHCCPVTGINYYRLKIFDKDNKTSYSNIKQVQFTELQDIKVYPNPLGNTSVLKLVFNKEMSADAQAYIYDESGKVILKFMVPKSAISYNLNVAKISKGIYFLTINSGSDLLQTKFIK